jgi:hypothetical protein
MVFSPNSELNVKYYLDKFQVSKCGTKIYAKRDAFMIECSKIFIMSYNAFYSLHPVLWFPSGPQKTPRGAFKDRRVSVYR